MSMHIRRNRIGASFLPLAALCFLTGCAASGDRGGGAEESATTGPRLIGRIASVPADKRFVLVQAYGKWNVEPGTILTTRGEDGRTANLRATGESLGQFAAADLQSGTVETGDAVYTLHEPKPPPQAVPVGQEPPGGPPTTAPATVPAEPELPDFQSKSDSENVQKNI